MSGNATETRSKEHKQLTETLDCGHSATRESTQIRETLDEVCVNCRTPIEIDEWDGVLRETTVHHTTGESTTYRTWLVGIDMRGRAVYYDEKNTRMLRVVPREDYRFKQFRDGDEEPTRGLGRAGLLNAPDGCDHLVSVKGYDPLFRESHFREASEHGLARVESLPSELHYWLRRLHPPRRKRQSQALGRGNPDRSSSS